MEAVKNNPNQQSENHSDGYQHDYQQLYKDYQLPEYLHAADVANLQLVEEQEHTNLGTIFKEHWVMGDEAQTEYNVLRCEASEPRTDVWTVKDLAWSTQLEGLNTDVARKIMRLGMNAIIKGSELHNSIKLSESAYNTHAILDGYQKLGYLDAKHIAVEGYSRGSMIGFGTNAYAEQFDRRVIYSNLTDPCMALGIHADAETVKKAISLPIDLGLLGAAALQGIIANPNRGRHLIKTIDFSPEGAAQFVRTGRHLLNGEAGMMATKTPLDMKATIAFFRLSEANDEPVYRQLLAGREGVRFVQPEGGHGGGIDSRIIGNVAVRMGRLVDQLAEGRSPDDINYQKILYGDKPKSDL
ncbi:MAG: hypothetical protein WCF91_00155 [bacterium]